MGLPGAATIEPMSQAVSVLDKQASLLILDNFEQLVKGGAEILHQLLDRVPTLRALVTSRQLLGLEGEREQAVPSLPTPNGVDTPERLSLFESVQLFVDRAQSSRPDFRVTNKNAAAVAEICDRLEGLPLAIELAAARANVLTPAQILAHLSRRFEFLVSRKRGVAERQRTLMAAVDWSYKLLTQPLQRFFCRLSVFRGGWTAGAAEAVCEEPLALDYLALLLECSLIQSVGTEQGIRFRMLETLREFGDLQLSEEQRLLLGRSHATMYLALAEDAEPYLWRDESLTWHDRLDAEYENLQTAFTWAECNDAATGLRLFGALGLYIYDRAHGFASWERMRQMLASCSNPGPERAKALWAAGVFADDWTFQRERFEESLVIYRALGRTEEVAKLLLYLGTHHGEQMQHDLAAPCIDEALSIYRTLGDNRGIALALSRQGTARQVMGAPNDARRLHTKSLELLREVGDLWGIANTLHELGYLAKVRGDFAEARRCYEEALEISRKLRHRRWLPPTLANFAASLVDVEEYDAADRAFEGALAACSEINDINWRAQTLELYGFAACKQGDVARSRPRFSEALTIRFERDPGSYPTVRIFLGFAWIGAESKQFERAVRLLAGHDSLHTSTGVPRPPHLQGHYDMLLRHCRAAVGEEDWLRCWKEGQAMPLETMVAYALEEYNEW